MRKTTTALVSMLAAEYSKTNTSAFWQDFAKAYQAKTGTKLDVQVISWSDIDQQSSTMIQNGQSPGHPQSQRLRQLCQGRSALQRG